jgi:hypothetical protein
MHTSLVITSFAGKDNVDLWSIDKWKEEIYKSQVLVMTPAIFLRFVGLWISFEFVAFLDTPFFPSNG